MADQFEKSLSSKRIQSWINQKHEQKVYLSLPKFKAELSFSPADHLQKLGIETAFTSTRTNFTKIRPFLYFIKHTPTNTILFMSRLSQP